jgi:hypothetical protein
VLPDFTNQSGEKYAKRAAKMTNGSAKYQNKYQIVMKKANFFIPMPSKVYVP